MINIGSIKGYYHLKVWILANIIQLSTYEFCKRFLNKDNDPCGRQFDQMTQAARSITANIAEGMSRYQTSKENAMTLIDVARASASELHGDYFCMAMLGRTGIWLKDSDIYQKVWNLPVDDPKYTTDWDVEAYRHILIEKNKFAPYLGAAEMSVVVNTLLILVNREIKMIEKLIQTLFERYKDEGGFRENLTHVRQDRLRTKSIEEGAPTCPQCGAPMIRKMAKAGKRTGSEFWGCSNYPKCTGTRPK